MEFDKNMNIKELRNALESVESITNATWMEGLDDRKKEELSFHDAYRDKERKKTLDIKEYNEKYGNLKFYKGNGLSQEYVENWIRTNSKNKVFLDYACGNGVSAIQAAKAGASLAIGIDLSRTSISNAKENARANGVSETTYFLQADCENTQFPDSCVDVVICSGMLHHLNLEYAFKELNRILATGGKILGVEALNYNPIIKLYRNVTSKMRTDWEKKHILSLKDINIAKKYFSVGETRYWHLLSILAPYLKNAIPILNAIDSIIMKVPLLQLMAWQFTFELIKKP
jgi:ubiquinone/menaquinone biosynthesis C-methylase UbiE